MAAMSSAARSSLLNGIGRPVVQATELRGEISAQPSWLTDAVVKSVYHARGTVKGIAHALNVKALRSTPRLMPSGRRRCALRGFRRSSARPAAWTFSPPSRSSAAAWL